MSENAKLNKASAGLYDFVGIGELAETVTHLLSLTLQQRRQRTTRPAGGTAIERYLLQQARDHLSTVREGFVLSLRTAQIHDAHELRFLLDRVLLDWSQLSAELEQNDSSPSPTVHRDTKSSSIQIERLRTQMLAFSMAAIALGHLPRLPADKVTFPRSLTKQRPDTPPTYADIRVPKTPAEMLSRIDEVQSTLWQILARDPQELVDHHYGRVRRTYGFFESSAHLTRREAARFGIQKPPSDVDW